MSKLPQGWVSVNIADVAEVNPRKSVDLSPDEFVTFVPMAAVSEITGAIATPMRRPLDKLIRGSLSLPKMM